MNAVTRKFEDTPATREGRSLPLIIGITGSQGAGKTWSALRLARGIQRVVGGEIFGVDTEDLRMLAYADYFPFRHVPFDPPHGPLHYMAAVEHCANRNARIVIVDQLSNEHDGEGGVLDQIDDCLDRKAGDNWEKRQQYNFVAQIEPKKQRKKLNRRIVHLASTIVFILLYRAEEKIKPKRGGEPEKLGWQAVTTSKLPYDMTVRFLLPPGSNGVPILQPTTPAEGLLMKNPEQFKGWFREGEPLCEEMGERMAQWARGGAPADEFDRLVGDYARCTDETKFAELEARRGELWKKSSPKKPRLKEASDSARKRLDEAKAAGSKGGSDAPDNAAWINTFREQTSSADHKTKWDECTAAYGGMVPSEVYDVYESTSEALAEREAMTNL